MQKIALVTGASRGLGAAMALTLAKSHLIIAVARTVGGLEELDDRIKAVGGSATLAPMDITSPEAMATLCRSVYDRWGKLDLWCHTAIHAAPLSPAQMIDEKDWEKSCSINVDATRRLIAYVAPLLGQDGQAVFFDDPRAGEKFFGAYGATKAAQIALAKTWAAETDRTGPKIRVLTPAPLATAVRARFFPGEDRSKLTPPQAEAERITALLESHWVK